MRRQMRVVIGLAILIFLSGCASHRGTPMFEYPMTTVPTYRLQAPDQIEISVLPQEELNRQVTLRPDGKISLPLIGDVMAEGLTPTELSDQLTTEYSKYVKNPSVSVIVVGFFSKKIYVVGEVFRQGAIPYTGPMTAFQAVEEAGSFTRRASLGRVIVVRGDLKQPQVIDINLKNVVKKGERQMDVYLKPSDIVFVPPNGFAKAGYAMSQVFFPFSPLLDLGNAIRNAREVNDTIFNNAF